MTADINDRVLHSELAERPARGLSLYVSETGTIKGRGVFAGRPYTKGELVEVCPVMVINSCVLPRVLANLLYSWEKTTTEPITYAIALGYGSLYNHANPSNVSYRIDIKAQVIRYFSARNIDANEELTINYSSVDGGCYCEDDTWFEQHQMVRLAEAPEAHAK
jgi:uncharacterized protein